ncbi:alginate O-acetyltransferase [Pseudomonas japonica]|uniref:alginate O-acetyltransferase n=1 Tax=Pseudomonas japonica TaxID=256466 RepID=UPI0015E3E958|nr:alginate O-acetyltransferase [Pseudomonas japonica]MBA1244630.1 alginate O-acetyltransferase [Pseudomonas japonica]
MTRSLRILYIAIFFGILVLMGLWSLVSFGSFERTAQMTFLNGKLTKAVETHYDEEFPIKRLGTNLWAAVDYKLFHEGRPGVVLGKDQWLFTDEEFKPVANGDQIEKENFALIRGVRDRLQQQGIKLVMAIIPAKARLYPEHFADTQPASMHKDLYEQFHAQAQQAGIFAPDLMTPLQQAKQTGQVFLRTDTHWTPLGAEVVARNIGAAISAHSPINTTPVQYVTEAEQPKPYKGDLTSFLPLDPLFTNLLPQPDSLQQKTTRAVEGAVESEDALFSDAEVPVGLVGTSYSANPHWNFLGALRESLHSDVVNYAEEGHGPILPMLKYLQSDGFKNNPPQVLVWEFPERYLPMKNDLSGFDPAWVAELKKTQDSNQNLAVGQNN